MMILATARQISYLQDLADKAEFIRMRHPSLIPAGLYHIKWEDNWVTSDKASLCIQFYREILAKADLELHPNKVAVTEDLPV